MIIAQETLVVNHLVDEAPSTKTGVSSNEIKHEVPLYPEPIFNVSNFTVTNSLLNSWLAVILLAVFFISLSKIIKQIPSRLQAVVEIITEGALKIADSVTGDRKKTLRIFPLVFGLFLFILLNNWLGLLPGVGSIGFIEETAGHKIFIPLLRGATADFNTTLALAVMSVFGANIFGVVMVGAWKYFNKFVNLRALAEIPQKIIKEPTIVMLNPIKFFVGLIEIVGEVAKVASLSFRLFGNIFAGEVLLISIAIIFAFIAPIPFIFLEVIVGIIQALIFAMLTLVYFTVASTEEEH